MPKGRKRQPSFSLLTSKFTKNTSASGGKPPEHLCYVIFPELKILVGKGNKFPPLTLNIYIYKNASASAPKNHKLEPNSFLTKILF